MTQHEIDLCEIKMLRRQRDKLLEALKAIRDHLVDKDVVKILNTILDQCEEAPNV